MTLALVLAAASLLGICCIWFGYPLVMWATASVSRSPHQGNRALGASRSVSVILATRDRAEIIHARVANLLDTQHPTSKLEVVIAIDSEGALCSPADLLGIGDRVRVIIGDAPGGKAAALNAGVRAATGEILVMADAQQRFDEHTIPELAGALEDRRFAAVSGALELGRNSTRSPVDYYWMMEKWLRFNESRVHSTVGVTGAVYATRRAVWPTVPAGTLLDDVYVPMWLVLAGHRIGFTYAAKAFDVRTFNAGNETARKTRTLTGVLQLMRLLPDVMSVRRNPIMLQFVGHKLLRLLTPLLFAVFAASLCAATIQMALHATVFQRVIGAGLLVLMVALPPVRRRIAGMTRWLVGLQLATSRALLNGITGRWSVWTKP